ncbi:NmrA family NAD(P)-binding protein [Devosia rhizoryzae]|uniref:NAD(P)H-binding protein n=1 Tax=Devosia rhizoryzae TaxID=2774137 RepID=A0ABX7CB11_9HYPH|nr:NAD(P)H-binding protein [Devosia rhizoryzae]QQR40892.1 NAD(P)H-binding protein [Devosia rhizoryzae]
MIIVLGASGGVGSEVVKALRDKGEAVLAVVHSHQRAEAIRAEGIEPVVVDLRNDRDLRKAFGRGKRAFLLNPPGDPRGDAEEAELETGRSIALALEDSGLKKVVLASTYGAQAGHAIGDLSTLFELERRVLASGIPVAINRGSYYFSNLDMLIEPARQGVLPTAFPEDFVLPMVAPRDLGRAAAERLTSGVEDVGLRNVEGPERYRFGQVAEVLGRWLGREVKVQTTPRDGWEDSFRQVGFSPESAHSFARMTEATVDGEFPEDVWRGEVGLEAYLAGLVGQQKAPPSELR